MVAEGLSDAETDVILSIAPQRLIEAGSFLDKMTGLWRYEFGIPYDPGLFTTRARVDCAACVAGHAAA